jgi:hypothetical protein
VTRTHRRIAAAALATALALGVAACGDDDPGPGTDDPTSAAPHTDSSAPSEEPSPTTTTPSVTPATGIDLAEETSAIKAPEGWTAAEPLVDWASSADGPARYDSVQLADRPGLSGTSDIDQLAESFSSSLPKGAKLDRLPNLELAGSPAYHFHYTVPGDPVLYDSITTLRDGRSITLDFFLNKNTATKQPELIESVLATFRWLS